MRRNATKVAAVVMSLAVTMTSVNLPTTAAAATKKVKLNRTKATLTVGKTTTLKVTKGGKAVKATFKSSNAKVAKVVTKSGKSTKIKALKKGTAKITATYAKKKYTCKITVKAKKVTTPTTAPTVEPTVAPTVEPTVTPATAGAITATLTNGLTGYDNIVLAGTTAKVQVKLTGADGKPAANKIVTASISAESDSAYYLMNGTSLVTTVTTNSEGLADIYVAPKESIKNTNEKAVGKYTIKLMGNSVEAKEFGFGVAALSFDALAEKTEKDKKVPGTNAADKGMSKEDNSGRTVKTATTYDKYKTPTNNYADYVTSQQVSADGVDHAVTFATGVSIKLPADIDKEATSYVQPVDVKSGNYSTYENRGDFIEFKLENKDDVKYATLLFNKLSVSKNTKITVYKANSKDDVKRNEPALATYDITNVTNDNGNYLTTNQALQIPVSVINDYKGVYVQIDSEGQVDTSCREGYDISKITYVYNKKTAKKTETLKGVKVNWETVKDVTYTTNRKLTSTDTDDYANIVAAGQSATYTMPVFPYTGDAIITVCDASNKPVKYFAVATANEKVTDEKGNVSYKNENKIIKTANAYQISKDEADRTVNGTVGDIVADKTTDTSVTVDSKQSGSTFVKGTLSADGVVFDEANKYVYTSVMWNPIPNAEKAQDTFYAIEGQTIKVKAQLKDRNGNAASIAGKTITFKDSVGNLNVNDTVGVSEKGDSDNSAKATVIDISNAGVTDSNGQVVLSLKAAAAANVYGVTATSTDGNYTVSLVFGDNSSAEKATLKWLGLGLSYKDSALDGKEIKTTDHADGRVDAADFGMLTSYKAGETWEVASKVYAYEAAADGKGVLKKDGKIVRYNVSGVKVDAKKESNSVGDVKTTDVNGRVTLASKADGKGKLDFVVNNVSGNDAKFDIGGEKTSVGTGVVSSDEKLTVAYKFGELAPQIAFVTDMGIKAVSGSSIDACIKLTDTLGNAIKDTPVTVKANKGTVNGEGSVVTKTDKNGIACVTVRQADSAQKYVTITADCKVKSDTITTSQTYEFVQKKVDNFTLAKAFDNNNNVIAEKDATYNVSTTGGYDTITLRFTDDVLASSAIKAVFNSSKVTVKDVNDKEANQYTVTNVAVSGDKVTLTLNVHLTNLSDEATITVTPASVFVGGVSYELTSVSGQKFDETNKIEFKKSNLQ